MDVVDLVPKVQVLCDKRRGGRPGDVLRLVSVGGHSASRTEQPHACVAPPHGGDHTDLKKLTNHI